MSISKKHRTAVLRVLVSITIAFVCMKSSLFMASFYPAHLSLNPSWQAVAVLFLGALIASLSIIAFNLRFEYKLTE
ncbi:hypothetical protein ACFL0K_01085 [Patescibacteria group bacterium]